MAIAADGSEYDVPVAEYLPRAFEKAEDGLRARVDELSVLGEKDRLSYVTTVVERLRACNFLGLVAGVQIPTQTMIEAQQAIDATIDY